MAQHDGERLGKGNLSLPDVVAQSVGYMGPVFSGTFFIPTIVGLAIRGQGRGHRHAVRDPADRHRHARAGLDHLALRQAHPRGGRALRLRRRGLRPPGRPLRRLGLLRRRADADARDRPGLRRLREPDAAQASTASTSTGSGSRSRSGSSPGRSRCSACRSRRAPSSSSRSSPSPSSSRGRSTSSSRAAATASRCGRSTRASPTSPGITYGIVYAGLIFVGFESAANLAEETAEPKRNIPRAIFYSVVAAGVFYVILVVGAPAGLRAQRRRRC